MTASLSVIDRLEPWDEVANRHTWGGILTGNGLSCAVWSRFGYRSLYERAASADDVAHPFIAEDHELFTQLKTTDFERILSALITARQVGNALHLDVRPITERYDSIKRALVEAVHSIHIAWRAAPEATLRVLRQELLRYKFVYSTNYDLLIYWAMMLEADARGFKDYFWWGKFDLANTEVWDKSTRVLFLHGALHLYRTDDDETRKFTAEEDYLSLNSSARNHHSSSAKEAQSRNSPQSGAQTI